MVHDIYTYLWLVLAVAVQVLQAVAHVQGGSHPQSPAKAGPQSRVIQVVPQATQLGITGQRKYDATFTQVYDTHKSRTKVIYEQVLVGYNERQHNTTEHSIGYGVPKWPPNKEHLLLCSRP